MLRVAMGTMLSTYQQNCFGTRQFKPFKVKPYKTTEFMLCKLKFLTSLSFLKKYIVIIGMVVVSSLLSVCKNLNVGQNSQALTSTGSALILFCLCIISTIILLFTFQNFFTGCVKSKKKKCNYCLDFLPKTSTVQD